MYRRPRRSRRSRLRIYQMSNLHITHSSRLCMRWSSSIHINMRSHLCVSLRSHLHISQGLRLSMAGHICLSHHLLVILPLNVLSCYLDILNNCIIELINKISSSSIRYTTSALDSVGCACLLCHPSVVRIGQGYPLARICESSRSPALARDLSAALPICLEEIMLFFPLVLTRKK